VIKPSQINDRRVAERELDTALKELRALYGAGSSNLVAIASIEYRIGALRRRARDLP
jgi:hypothetical protein